jgi:Na+-transporting NADH:ubiquinone oxidoreductase subunit NqrF
MVRKDKYVYVTSNRDVPDVFVPESPVIYYQLCQFADMKTGRYHMRKIIYGQDNVVKNIIYYYLTPSQRELFYQYKSHKEYKEYPNYDFSQVELPEPWLLDQARSELFNGTGYGPQEFKMV